MTSVPLCINRYILLHVCACYICLYRGGGGYSTLSWVRMCGPKFRTPPYNKTREDANLLPISKPFVSLTALFKTNQCFLQCKLGCISTFWQPVDKPKDKFIGNYAFCKNATYIKTNFQIKKGPLQNLRARKSTLSGPHIPVPTFPLSTPPGFIYSGVTGGGGGKGTECPPRDFWPGHLSGAPNEITWQISAPQPACSWLARKLNKFKILAGKLKI